MSTRTERLSARIDATLDKLEQADDPAAIRDLAVGVVALGESLDSAAKAEDKVIVHASVIRQWRESIRRLLGELVGQEYDPGGDETDPTPRSYDLDLDEDLVVGEVNELRLRLADAAELARQATAGPRNGEAADAGHYEELDRFISALGYALAGDPGHARERDDWQDDRRRALERHAGTLRLGTPADKVSRRAFYDVKDGVLYDLEDRVA